ncbi:MAG: ROK family glucokinase [Lachnospiraceae bacterium]|nr:ROK family glucokinase [Lachnospiraceae bacterium]
MEDYVFGADIGGTTVKLGLFRDGSLISKSEIPTRTDSGGAFILPDIAGAVLKELREKKIDVNNVAGIGAGVPGAVTDERIVNKCVNLGWGVTDVASELSGLTGIGNVKAANDANAAALGELHFGGGRGCRSMVMLTLGTGVGAGVIIDGKIVSGAFGAAGEAGHITVSPDEAEACGCGKRGHLEQYASATGIVRTARKLLENTGADSALGNIPGFTARDVFRAAKEGDITALTAVDRAADMLGLACSYISCVVDPEAFVIGGGVSLAGDFLLNRIKAAYRKYAFHASEDTEFRLASLGNDAGMYGAAMLISEE